MPLPLANILTYFSQSNFAGQAIVILLILFSILAWSVMLGKYLDLKRMKTLNLSYERHIEKVRPLIRMAPQPGARGPYALLTREALEAYHRAHGPVETRMGHVENAIHRGVAKAMGRYESKMILLGSIVTGAPFLGLLGTVWGVMDSFGSIATETTATLQMLAPGVSGALLTTVAGLLVAIPSVFGYNFLLGQTKTLATDLENFASTLADAVELEAREEEMQNG